MEQLVEKVGEQVKVSKIEGKDLLYDKGFELRCKGWCHDGETTYYAEAKANPEYFSRN